MEITIEYIAGFFDGDGNIGIYYRYGYKDRFHLRTQLTQNKNKNSTVLMQYLVNKYGGNLSEQITQSGKVKYNWQLNADLSVLFLKDIEPYLIMKKLQAQIAIEWQRRRPKPIRDEQGRIQCKRIKDRDFDIKVSELLKSLKSKDIDVVMENQKDLVEIVTELKPLAVVKG